MNQPARFVASGVATALLGVHRSTLLRWEDQGLIQPHKLRSGHRRYLLSELRKQLNHPTTDAELNAAVDRLEGSS
jgi:predicted site-specific integrase-resolvase